MNKNIWTPYKIWDETQWFTDFEKIMKKLWKRTKIKMALSCQLEYLFILPQKPKQRVCFSYFQLFLTKGLYNISYKY